MERNKVKKAELHLHLDGSLRPETVLEIAERDNIELPSHNLDELKKYLKVDDTNEDLVEYLKRFELPLKVMQTKENLKRTSYELVEDLAKENYIYAEIRFAPHLHLKKGLSLEEVVESVIDGIRDAEKKYDIEANILLCIMRHMPEENGHEILQLAKKFKGNKVVGIDLAGDEANYSPLIFRKIFEKAKGAEIPFTIHAGEARGVDGILEALVCGPERLGHGIRSFEEERVLDILREKNITLECCPISNYHTRAIDDFDKYPLKDYLQDGIRATLNTDNRTVSDTNYLKELEFLDKHRALSDEEILNCSVNAIMGAFISDERKAELLDKLKDL
jgi:adenosine deaminase